MSVLLGITKYEYLMSVRRWGLWIPILVLAFIPSIGFDLTELRQMAQPGHEWNAAGKLALCLNFFLPILAGIAMADRLTRDKRFGVRELLFSTKLTRRTYVFGKYMGTVLSVLTPVFVVMMILVAALLVLGSPWTIVPISILAFLAIIVPGYLFFGAAAVACPAIMPVRVFQVLFTGYWVWGNFISPDFMPTLAGTILVPSGQHTASAFFGVELSSYMPTHTVPEAIASMAALSACAVFALIVLNRYLAWQEARS